MGQAPRQQFLREPDGRTSAPGDQSRARQRWHPPFHQSAALFAEAPAGRRRVPAARRHVPHRGARPAGYLRAAAHGARRPDRTPPGRAVPRQSERNARNSRHAAVAQPDRRGFRLRVERPVAPRPVHQQRTHPDSSRRRADDRLDRGTECRRNDRERRPSRRSGRLHGHAQCCGRWPRWSARLRSGRRCAEDRSAFARQQGQLPRRHLGRRRKTRRDCHPRRGTDDVGRCRRCSRTGDERRVPRKADSQCQARERRGTGEGGDCGKTGSSLRLQHIGEHQPG